MRKLSVAMGSALPDPVAATARPSPVPTPAIENKTAPGQRGPVGLSPRTTYSRVNTGTPPVPDAGMSLHKSAPPRGSEFLPNKLAHQEVFMATSADRPSLNDMVKAAMAGTIAKSEITREALRQTGEEFSTKIASAQYSDDHVSTQDVHKLASALGYLANSFRKEAYDLGPGAGPGALEVSGAKASGNSLDAGESGHAIASNQPPMTPALQRDQVQSGKSNTGLQDDLNKKAGVKDMATATGTYVKGMAKRLTGVNDIQAGRQGLKNSKLVNMPEMAETNKAIRNDAYKSMAKGVGKAVGTAGAVGGAGYYATHRNMDKKSSAPVLLLRKIAANAPDASASGMGVPSEPGDVSSQKRMISSNQSAIDYTRREAKSVPKREVGKYLDQPALTVAGDSVLAKSLEHTNSAGAKIAAATTHLERVGKKTMGLLARTGGGENAMNPETAKRIGKAVYGTGAAAAAGGGAIYATRDKKSSADFSKVAAARALLSNLMDKVSEEQGKSKKTKEAVVPLNISSPSDSSGFQAQGLK